jgi:hypothetical protein
MLGPWLPHHEYQQMLILKLIPHYLFNKGRVVQMEPTIMKLFHLDMDKVLPIIKPLYSATGAPAKEQAAMIRSLFLMIELKEYSISQWAETVANDKLYYDICGFQGKAPSTSSYYDLIDRMWLGSKSADVAKKRKLRSFQSKPRKKLKQGQKLPPKHKGAVRKLVMRAKLGTLRRSRREEVLQQFFSRLVVDTSAQMGLLGDTNAMSIAGDGTPYYSGASSYGIKVCECKSQGIFNCQCPRRYSDPDATWGWDSYRELYFFGDSLYAFTAAGTKHDLPIYLRMVQAKRHDSITTIFALQEFRELFPSLRVENAIFDGAMDNYPTYELCYHWNIRPFIPLDEKTKIALKSLPKGVVAFNHKGEPICEGGIPYAYWGCCYGKGHKYRCWFAANNKPCPCKCSDSSYGRTVYIKPDDDLRLFPAISRQSETYKEKLRQRSGAERINKRIFNDYDVEKGSMRSTKHRFFRAVLAAANVHLDLWVKYSSVKLTDLLDEACAKTTA